jgi:hypothetical protein
MLVAKDSFIGIMSDEEWCSNSTRSLGTNKKRNIPSF